MPVTPCEIRDSWPWNIVCMEEMEREGIVGFGEEGSGGGMHWQWFEGGDGGEERDL